MQAFHTKETTPMNKKETTYKAKQKPKTCLGMMDINKLKSMLEFVVGWSTNPTIYAKKSQATQNEATEALKSDKNKDDYEPMEVGFVDHYKEKASRIAHQCYDL